MTPFDEDYTDERCKRCETRAPFRIGAILCKTCAKEVAKAENVHLGVPTINRDGADQVGRPMLSSNTAGGTARVPGPNE